MIARPLLLWSRLIQAAALVVLSLSATLLLLPGLGEAVFYQVYYGQITSPVPVPGPVQAYIRFANGIIGAVMVGWMLAIIWLARGPLLHGQRYAWGAIAWPLLGWYVIDSTFSLAHGIWGNVILNTGTAVLFRVPLLFSRRHCRRGD